MVSGSWKGIDLPSFVAITCTVCELYVFYLGPAQSDHTIVSVLCSSVVGVGAQVAISRWFVLSMLLPVLFPLQEFL